MDEELKAAVISAAMVKIRADSPFTFGGVRVWLLEVCPGIDWGNIDGAIRWFHEHATGERWVIPHEFKPGWYQLNPALIDAEGRYTGPM